MEDEDYRIMVLNNTTMKVFRDGRIHTFRKDHNVWYAKKFCVSHNGYFKIDLGIKPTKRFFVHNIITLCYLGHKPEGHQTDHINNIRTDNRLENLQYLTNIENNRKRLYSYKGLIKGYYLTPSGKFSASLHSLGKHISLGSYDTEDEARQAYVDGKLKYHNVEIKQ